MVHTHDDLCTCGLDDVHEHDDGTACAAVWFEKVKTWGEGIISYSSCDSDSDGNLFEFNDLPVLDETSDACDDEFNDLSYY